MKIALTILFFTCTLLLVTFSMLLLQFIDDKAGIGKILLTCAGILTVIFCLGILLNQYLMIPPKDHDN